jgi:hypothetical protein
MFQTVRHWWGSGRGKITLRLFLFEFTVVVAGVLAAQGLASWVGSRAEDRAVDEEHARMLYEIGRTRQNARIWLAAAPCLEQRVDSIVRKAATDAVFTSDELALPQFIGYTVEGLSPDMYRQFRDRFGADRVDDYTATGSAADAVFTAYREVLRGWDRFALVDPAMGQPSTADRATVRDVALQVRSQIRRLRIQAREVERISDRLGIAPLTENSTTGVAVPVTNCVEIWQTGRIWHEAPR